jgi:SAM-dependent methyltransferase
MCGVVGFAGRNVLDVGCGRGDLLEYLRGTGREPKEYIGVEAVPELASAAEVNGKAWDGGGERVRIVRKDFVAEPACLFTCSDVVAISGSLNTADDEVFYSTLRRAYDATAHDLVFNFLCSSELAGAPHLFYRDAGTVERFCRNVLGAVPKRAAGYLRGDATVALHKPVR